MESACVYFSTDRGLATGTEHGSGWAFERPTFDNPNGNLPSIGVEADASGAVWFGCGKLLCVLEGGRVRDYGAGDGLPSERWHWVHLDGAGNLWLRSETSLFVRPKGRQRFEDAGAGLPRSTYGPAPMFESAWPAAGADAGRAGYWDVGHRAAERHPLGVR